MCVCNSLIGDVVMEPGLCKDVGTTVCGFPIAGLAWVLPPYIAVC